MIALLLAASCAAPTGHRLCAGGELADATKLREWWDRELPEGAEYRVPAVLRDQASLDAWWELTGGGVERPSVDFSTRQAVGMLTEWGDDEYCGSDDYGYQVTGFRWTDGEGSTLVAQVWWECDTERCELDSKWQLWETPVAPVSVCSVEADC